MNRHEVTSQLFRSSGYDPTTGVLELEYRNGACRRWLAVPAKVYQAFCAAAALQLADSNISMMRKNFDVITERTVRELNGESCLGFEDAPPPKQQIVNSCSFGQRITRLEEMQQAVVLYATRAAEKLREQNSRCRHISVSIATARHGDEPQYSNTASRIWDYPTNDTRDIIESAIRGLSTIWREGYRYAKAGVMLGYFYQSGVAQFDMFSEQKQRENADALMAALDTINQPAK